MLAAASAPAGAETLLEALSSAYKFNPRLDAARATQRATDEEVPRALSGYRPSIIGSADTSFRNIATTPGSTASGESNPRGYQVGLVQPLFRGFRTVNAVNAAEATVRAGRETLRLAEQSVLLEAVTAYGDVVRDAAIVRLRENNVTVLTARSARHPGPLQRRRGDAHRRGPGPGPPRRRRGRPRPGPRQPEDVARHLRAGDRPSPSNLAEARASSMVAKTLSENVDISLRESPNVVAALYREQAARFSIDLVRGELLPTAQLEANYAKRFDDTAGLESTETSSVTGRLTVPFYTGGEVQARVRQAKQTQIQRLQEIEQARTETQAQVVTAWAQLLAAQAAVEIGPDRRQRQPHRAGRRARGGAGGPAHAARRAQRRAGTAERGGQTWSPTSATWWWPPTPCSRRWGASTPRT